MLTLVPGVHAEYFYVKEWGSNGSANSQFYQAYGIALDSSGNVYVADNYNDRVQKFDSNGGFLSKFGMNGSGNGQFKGATDVAVDLTGNIYVLDWGNYRVQKFDSNGTYITKWGSYGSGNGTFYYPARIAVDTTGDIYVSDPQLNLIQKFNSSGTFLTQWGSPGTGNGQFNASIGIAAWNGYVFVADFDNHRIQKFYSNGTYVTQWGTYGTGNGEFNGPTGVAVTYNGEVFVSEHANRRVQMFSPYGDYITKFGGSGTGPGQFQMPWDVAATASSDYVYVIDPESARVQKFKAGFLSASSNKSIGPIGTVFRISGTYTWGDSPSNYAYIVVTNNTPPYIIGSLPQNGVKPDNFSVESISGNNSTFVRATVSGESYSYDWDTANITGGPLLPGSQYLFYVVKQSLNMTDARNTAESYTKLSIGIEGPVHADYTVNTSSGTKPLTVAFTDISTGIPTTSKIDFGDGSPLVDTWSGVVMHTYNNSGIFTPIMYANNSISSDSGTNATITVTAIPAPVASFTENATSGTVPLSVQFNDTSTGSPTGRAWFFGDENFTVSWTQQNASSGWSGRSMHSSVVMPDGSIVLMGGSAFSGLLNDTWRSTDNGETWTLMNASSGWSERYSHSSVAMPDGSIVLMGGHDDDVKMNDTWRSTDKGATWTQMTANADWTPRQFHSSVALPDGSIVLMGGLDDATSFKNDTWRSTDNGTTWAQQTANAGWSARDQHTSVVMPNGSIVLIGGYGWPGFDLLNDTWRSTDNGTTWTQQSASAGWTARFVPITVAMPDNSIVLIGGTNGSDPKNDTWRSTDN